MPIFSKWETWLRSREKKTVTLAEIKPNLNSFPRDNDESFNENLSISAEKFRQHRKTLKWVKL